MAARLYVGSSTANRERELRAAFEYVGLYGALSAPGRVFVKPNFTFPRPVPGVTTSTEMLEDTLRLLVQTGTEVLVGESNGGYGSFLASEAFAGHGLEAICKRTGAQAIDLSKQESRDYARVIGGRRVTVRLPRILVDEVDFTVSVAVLKVHAMTTVSLSVKNLWGCYPVDLRLLRHAKIARELRFIVDLVKARFGLIDGTYGLDGHGPMDGTVRPIGKFLAGNDPYALDWLVARMMGFKPEAIHHLQMISRESLASIGEGRVETNIPITGINWGFTIDLNVIDALSLACFHSDLLAKIVFDSPFTTPIYAVVGRKPRRRLT